MTFPDITSYLDWYWLVWVVYINLISSSNKLSIILARVSNKGWAMIAIQYRLVESLSLSCKVYLYSEVWNRRADQIILIKF